MVKHLSALVALLISVLSSQSHAQVQIGNAYYYPASYLVGEGNVVGIENRSSLPDGKITIQEKNICPQTYHGGTLAGITEFLQALTNATMVNGEIYAQWPPVAPVNGPTQRTGERIWALDPPFPQYGQTVTFQGVFTPAVYLYSMTCYYAYGCPEEGPNVGACEWNAPSYWIGINLENSQPKLNLSLPSGPEVFSATPSEVIPTDVPSFSVKPNIPTRLFVKVLGTGISANESRSTVVSLKIGNRNPIQQNVPLSMIAASGSYLVPFDVVFTAEEAGELQVSAEVDPGNALQESDTSDNFATKKIYALCNVEDQGREVPYFAQGGISKWASDDYANQAPNKLSQLGCYTTSFAMLISSYGIKRSADGVSDIDPGSVNAGLGAIGYYKELGPTFASYSGYTSTGAVHPIGAVNFARASYAKSCIAEGGNTSACKTKAAGKISYVGRSDTFSQHDQYELDKQLCAGNPVILKVKSISSPNDPRKAHFVLGKGMTVAADGSLQYLSYDPARVSNPLTRTFSYKISDIKGFRLYKQMSDPSMISIHLSGGLNMIITDPIGNKTGYDPNTGQFYNSIPGATYTLPESIDSPDGNNISTPLEATFENVTAIDGRYQVQIFGNSNIAANYRLTRYSFDDVGNINAISDKSGKISAGQSVVLTTDHTSTKLPVRYANLIINKALFFDSGRKDKAFISGQITPEDGRSISRIDKFVTVRVGLFVKSIELKEMQKIKLKKDTYYIHLDWGRKGLAFVINADTGEFNLYVDNIDLDDTNPSLMTNVDIQIDDLQAENVVTFKDVKRRKIGN